MGGDVIQELMACVLGRLGAEGLSRRDGGEGGRERGVNGTAIVQERADDLTNIFDAVLGQFGRRVIGDWMAAAI